MYICKYKICRSRGNGADSLPGHGEKHTAPPKPRVSTVTTVCVQGDDLLALGLDAIEQVCFESASLGSFSVHDSVERWSESLVHVCFPDAKAASRLKGSATPPTTNDQQESSKLKYVLRKIKRKPTL